MREGFEHIDGLIAKALAGEASPEELSQLSVWRHESAENENYYAESEKIFMVVGDLNIDLELNEDSAWNKLNEKLEKKTAKIIPFYRRTSVLRAVAGVALLLTLTIVSKWFINEETLPPLVLSSNDRPSEQKLPDGSKVFMNKNTGITYSSNEKGERKVSLKGEAFFEVVHDDARPFVIAVNDVMIRDIGTSFNVKALPESNIIEVVVESGEVQFYSSGNLGINLVKGEKATYDKVTRHFTKMLPVPTENTAGYRSKRFSFKETPLKEVVSQLNACYPVQIRLQDKELENLKLSVLFNHEEPESIVDIIADTFDLEVQKTDSLFILKHKISK